MPSRAMKRRARAQARAQNAPARAALGSQVRATQRESRRESSALSSEGRALASGIGAAGHDLRRVPGLSGRDQRIALEELAARRVDAASGIQNQQSVLSQDTRDTVKGLRQSIVDVGTQRGADYQAALAQEQAQRQQNQHDVRMAHLGANLDLRNALAQTAADQSSSGGSGGLTANELRGITAKRRDALALVRSAYLGSAGRTPTFNDDGSIKQWSAPPLPTNHQEWQSWADMLYGANHTTVDRGDLQWAIDRYRQHIRQRPNSSVALTQVANASPVPPLANVAATIIQQLLGRR